MLTPSRLTLARRRRGLTAIELARKAGLSARTIGDYEHGRRQPGAGTTESLTTALGFPDGFLTQAEPADLPETAIAFRAVAKLPGRTKAAAISAGQLAIEFNGWLERTFTVPDPDVPTLEHPDPETAAEMVRARWGLHDKAAPNMVQLLESRGVRVFSLPADCADVDAFSFWHAGTPYVFLNPATSPERGRFDAAHELGHLVLHQARPPQECEANAFAGAFLMPKAGMHLKNPTTEQVLAHRADWHVSALALTYRLRDLGLLSQEQYAAICVELSRRGYRTSEPDGMARRETSRLLATVFREQGIKPHQVARELLLDVEELNGLVFGLVLTAVPGGGEPSARQRPRLRVVRPAERG